MPGGSEKTIASFQPVMSTEIVRDTEELWAKSKELGYSIWNTVGLEMNCLEDFRKFISVNFIDFVWIPSSKKAVASTWFMDSLKFLESNL